MSCLNHLKICNAECCKELTIDFGVKIRAYKGLRLKWVSNDVMLNHYYALHNAHIHNNLVSIVLNRFKQKGSKITIYGDCKALKDNLCIFHNTDKQPGICKYPNPNHRRACEGIYLTPNCVYNG